MNERIYKLAQEAGFSTWVLNPSKETMSDTPELLKKFAELIVRDVLDEVLQAMDDGMDVYYTVADKFGVKE